MKKKFGECLSYGDLSLIVSGVWMICCETEKHYYLYSELKDSPPDEWYLDVNDAQVILDGLDEYAHHLNVGKIRRDAFYGTSEQAVSRIHTLKNLFIYWCEDNF